MRSKYIAPLTLLAFWLPVCVFSQSVISTAGNQYSFPSYTYDWTIGEPIIGSFTDKKTLTQGFHQGEWIILSHSERDILSGVKIYPNPSNGRLVIEWRKPPKSFDVMIYDANGKLVCQEAFQGFSAKAFLNVSAFVTGYYSVLIISESPFFKRAFKLLKTQ